MSNVDAMRALGEDIIASYDVRVSAIPDLVKETADILSKFATERQEMSKTLKASLAQGESDRKATFNALSADIQAKQQERNELVKALLADIRAKQQERNEQVKRMLDSYKVEREEVASEWQELVATMQSRRSGAPAVEEAPAAPAEEE